MTVQELHYDFDLKIDKVATLTRRDFSLAEKDWLLNEANISIVKKYYLGNNASGTAFETTQKRWDDLSPLVIKFPDQPEIIPTLIDNSGVYEVALNDLKYPYWFYVRGSAMLIDKNNCVSKAKLKLIQHDDFSYAIDDPFNMSNKQEVLFNFGRSSNASLPDFSRSSIYLYPGLYSLGPVSIEYIKKPNKISYGGYLYIDGITYPAQTSELPDHLHNELVDLAVDIASGTIESPEYVQLKAKKVFANE